MSLLRSLLACALLVVSLLGSGAASAETLTCTDITTLPYTISASGNYCLNKNFTQAFATAAINITTNNVVLDCNDHIVTNTSPTVTGVYGSNRTQVTVRNCALIGFTRGITFVESGSGLSRNNHFTGNSVRKSQIAGIQVAGSANLIDNNQISDNIGVNSSTYTYGILLSSFGATGVGNVVRNNLITNIAPSVYVRVTGIYLLDVHNTAVKDNIISALFPPRDLGVYGIVGSPTTFGTAAVGNTILSATGGPPAGGGGLIYDGASYDGIRFDAAPTTSNHNVCRNNTVGHFVSNIFAETAGAGCVIDANTAF